MAWCPGNTSKPAPLHQGAGCAGGLPAPRLPGWGLCPSVLPWLPPCTLSAAQSLVPSLLPPMGDICSQKPSASPCALGTLRLSLDPGHPCALCIPPENLSITCNVLCPHLFPAYPKPFPTSPSQHEFGTSPVSLQGLSPAAALPAPNPDTACSYSSSADHGSHHGPFKRNSSHTFFPNTSLSPISFPPSPSVLSGRSVPLCSLPILMGVLTPWTILRKILPQGLVPLALGMFLVGSRAGPLCGDTAATPILQSRAPSPAFASHCWAFPKGWRGMHTPPSLPNIRGSPQTLPSKGAHAAPLVMPLAFTPALTFPKLTLWGCLLLGFNPTSPGCWMGSPSHGHPIPKELCLVVEVPLGVSWLFPCNEALVYSKALGVLLFARERPGSRAPSPSS